MKKHIILLIIALLLLAMCVFGLRSCDGKVGMPLLGAHTVGDGTGMDDNTVTTETADNAEETPDADAATVDALLKKIGSPVSLEDKAAIEAARAAYDKLSDEAKARTTGLPALERAEAALAELEKSGAGAAKPDAMEQPAAQTDSGAGAVYAPGDAVVFTGGNVYVSSNAANAARVVESESSCTVTCHVEDAGHPYHLISQDGGGVYGWVDASSVKKG